MIKKTSEFCSFSTCMLAPNDYQSYLQEICCRYKQWWTENALTEAIAVRQANFSFEQVVQIEERSSDGSLKKVTLPIFEAIQEYIDSEHILLVGSPGVGKSSALLRCIVQLAEREREKPEPRIPILVPLKNYKASFSSSKDPSGMLALIRNSLPSSTRRKVNISEVEELLFDKRLILLLDGLNELPAEAIRTHLKKFREDCQRAHVLLICTTRELYGGDLGIQRRLEVQPLKSGEIDRFLQECFPEQAQNISQLLHRDNRELGRTPFMLWMLYDLFQKQGTEVETLAEAFRHFFRFFNKNYKEDVPVIDERRKDWSSWLKYLAFTMLDDSDPANPGLVISRERANQILDDQFGMHPDKSSRIEELLKYHVLESVNHEEITFHHQLIQEYYAAEYLLTRLPNLLKEQSEQKYTGFQTNYLNYLKWTEAITLMLGLPEIEDQIERVLSQARKLDWLLEAKVASGLREAVQKARTESLIQANIPQNLKTVLLGKTRSDHAVPFLERILQASSQKLYITAAEALGEVGSELAISCLKKALTSKKLDLCKAAIWALGRNGTEAAIAVLHQALNRKEVQIRLNIAEALGEVTDEVALPALAKALKDKNTDVRCSAANSLWGIRSDLAVAILAEALDDRNTEVVWWIVQALGEIGNEAAISALEKLMVKQPNSEVRQDAASALGETGNQLAVPILSNALRNHKDFEVKVSAIEALGEIGNEAALDILYQALEHKNPNIRHRAIDAIAFNDGEANKAVLLKALHKNDSYICCAAIDALGRFSYEPAYPLLRDKLMNENSLVRISATTTLRKMGIEIIAEAFSYNLELNGSFHIDLLNAGALGLVDAQEAIDAFAPDLNHENPYIRSAIVYMLGEIDDQKSIPYILEALNDEDAYVRASAIEALVSLEYEEILLVLEQALRDEDSHVRYCTIDALKAIGCHSAISILVQALEQDGLNFDATEALKEIGGEKVIKAVTSALEHLDDDVCLSAFEVIAAIGDSPLLPHLAMLLKGGNIKAMPALIAIQSRCKFYNYEIYQYSQEIDESRNKSDLINQIYNDIDKAVAQIQRNPELRQNDNEDRLTIELVGLLRIAGYNANHDCKIGGHVDLTVEKDDFVWLGEAKKYKDNNYLWEGFLQLTTRYSIGDNNQNSGGLLIYILDEDAGSVMEKWQIYLSNKNLPDYSCRPCKFDSLAFVSSHRHNRSGLLFHVRHSPVLLHFSPQDKSGRRSSTTK